MFTIDDCDKITISNLTIMGSPTALRATNSTNLKFNDINFVDCDVGVDLDNCSDVEVENTFVTKLSNLSKRKPLNTNVYKHIRYNYIGNNWISSTKNSIAKTLK